MPLSIDGMNIGVYGNRSSNFNAGLQTNRLDRASQAGQPLDDAQERLLERRRLEQDRQEQLNELREQRIARQEQREERELQVRLEREQAAQALDEQLREQRLETLQEQREAYYDPLSAENLARQRTQLDVSPPTGNNTGVSPRLAAEAISTYRQTASPDFIGRSLVA